MNIHIEINRYRSEAEVHQEAAARRKRFEMAGRLASLKKSAPTRPAPPVFVAKIVPQWELYVLSFDAHILEYQLRKANPALAYLKDRCGDLDVLYRHIIGPSRRDAVIEIRHLLMWEIYAKFDLSLPQIGRMFGGRDHTTVLHAVKKTEARMSMLVMILAWITQPKFH